MIQIEILIIKSSLYYIFEKKLAKKNQLILFIINDINSYKKIKNVI